MRKYLILIQNYWQEYFTYRLNFILWRVRVVVSILITYFLWQAIFKNTDQIFGYQEKQMLTYVMLLIVVNSVVFSSQTSRVADEINSGTLSNFLIRPLNYFGYNISRDLADKLLNISFSFFEIALLIFLLKPPLMPPTNLLTFATFIFVTILACLLYFEISMILSFIGFWSKETWAPRFIFFITVSFLAGNYFPLDIFPAPIYNILRILPFTYLIFFPIKTYLGTFDNVTFMTGLTIMFFWLFILYFVLKFLWRKGLKAYTSEGR